MVDTKSCTVSLKLVAMSCFVTTLAACSDATHTVAAPSSSDAPAPASEKAGPALVVLEGCVVDLSFIPRTGTPLRFFSDDGRLLGHAVSGAHGEFVVRVVSMPAVTVVVDRDSGESMRVPTAGRDTYVTSCIQDAVN